MSDEPKLTVERVNERKLVSAGQRKINLIWETTQAIIALMITAATIYGALQRVESAILNNAFFLIVSMYFVRTNHNLMGGVKKLAGRGG